MDDTLVSTAALWRSAETALLVRLGSAWSPDLAATHKGMNALDVAAVIHRRLQPPVSVKFCQEFLREELVAAFGQDLLRPMPGAIECVQRLSALAPLGLASGSPLPAIELVLARTGLREKFSHWISSEFVPRGKPAPDVFLAAAAALEAEPSRCLVLEDSLVGVRAARAAGMSCFAVPSGSHQEIARMATRTFASLAEVRAEDVLACLEEAIPDLSGGRGHIIRMTIR